MLKTIDKYNISTWFLYPLYGLPTEVDNYLLNTYLYSSEYEGLAEHLHILLKQPNTISITGVINSRYDYVVNTILSHANYFDSYKYSNDEECLVLEIPEKFTDDYYKVISGKYSELSATAKDLIKTRFNYMSIHNILNKSQELKKQIETIVGTELPEGSEV